ncbi:MAG: 16S rRNA (cytidine(1402)-2'-O)-methyltransferase [Gammaproteobacteria bacterium]|nr:16S rRNA (cytidine(1402)-2'-O)-methyltransferase [Gammaproteobacteria bacterium]
MVAPGPGSDTKPGQLFVVATPIGNLQDITERARRVLCEVALVAAEDTRHSRKLLQHVGSQSRCVSLHQHNEERRIEQIVATLQGGDNVALVSDAGTPLISDPGYLLVCAVQRAGIAVVPVPGPSAVTAALSVATLPTDRFCFEGFLPARDKARRERLRELLHEQRTMVFFEAPHRILATLQSLCDEFGGERPVTLARELTKQFETVLHGDLQVTLACLQEQPDNQRGEFVIVVGGAPRAPQTRYDSQNVLETLLEELPPAKAARVAARLTGEPRKALYALAMQLNAGKSSA